VTHQLEFVPWLSRLRRQAASVFVVSAGALIVAEMTYSSLSAISVFALAAEQLGTLLPWVDVACGLTAAGAAFALASTWSYRDWWVERWARSHESYVS
jgi:hypothetical protein